MNFNSFLEQFAELVAKKVVELLDVSIEPDVYEFNIGIKWGNGHKEVRKVIAENEKTAIEFLIGQLPEKTMTNYYEIQFVTLNSENH